MYLRVGGYNDLEKFFILKNNYANLNYFCCTYNFYSIKVY